MSARARAHPWWGERVDLNPNHFQHPSWGDGSITVKLKIPLCSACGQGPHEHVNTSAGRLCPPFYATLYCQRFAP